MRTARDAMPQPEAPGLQVACLCAQWCDACRQYRPAYDALRAQFPGVRFAWVDIEDEAQALGELDIETFPTLLIGHGAQAMFLGPLQPQAEVLRRLLARFAQQAPAPLPAGHEAHALLQRVQALPAPGDRSG